jgi:hypothetical protein
MEFFTQMTVTTYTSASRGVTLTIANMPTPHIENAVAKIKTSAATLTESQVATLAALETELGTRDDRTVAA